MRHSLWNRKGLFFDASSANEDTEDGALVAVAPLDGAPGFNVELTVKRFEGQAAIQQITVWSDEPATAVTNTALMQRLRLTALQEKIRDALEGDYGAVLLPETWHDNFLSVPHPGRRGRPPVEYAIWARRYVRALEQDSKRPIQWLAGRFDMDPDKVSRIVNRATAKGFLDDRVAGKPGGCLSRAAKQLLKHVPEGDE